MNLLVLKKWGTKSLLWLKNHWYYPLSAIVILISYVLFKEKAESLMKALMENREGYKQQAKQVDKIHENQINERNKHLVENSKKLKELDEKHAEKVKEFDKKVEKMTEELVHEEDLAAEFDKEFNL